MSPVAIIVAVLALVLAAAGAGYSAGKIGTKDIKNNAVTSPKIKNGTVTNADLVKEKKATKISAAGAPNFSNGGQGDCTWQSAAPYLAGLGDPAYRVDRSGTVHLSGVAVATNGTGGDATCDPSGETEDGIVTVLPHKLRPASTQIYAVGTEAIYLVGDTPISPLPAGAVYWSGSAGSGVFLDGLSYLPATSPLAARATAKAGSHGKAIERQLLRQLKLG